MVVLRVSPFGWLFGWWLIGDMMPSTWPERAEPWLWFFPIFPMLLPAAGILHLLGMKIDLEFSDRASDWPWGA